MKCPVGTEPIGVEKTNVRNYGLRYYDKEENIQDCRDYCKQFEKHNCNSFLWLRHEEKYICKLTYVNIKFETKIKAIYPSENRIFCKIRPSVFLFQF